MDNCLDLFSLIYRNDMRSLQSPFKTFVSVANSDRPFTLLLGCFALCNFDFDVGHDYTSWINDYIIASWLKLVNEDEDNLRRMQQTDVLLYPANLAVALPITLHLQTFPTCRLVDAVRLPE
jgi:hypothetical protein